MNHSPDQPPDRPGDELRQDLLDMFDAKVGSWLIDDLSRDERQRVIEQSAGAAGMISTLMNADAQRPASSNIGLPSTLA